MLVGSAAILIVMYFSRKADAIIMRVLFPFSNGCETGLVSAREFGSLKRDMPCLLPKIPTTGKVAQLDSEDAVLESPAKVRKVTMKSLRRDNEIKAESVKILHKKICKLEEQLEAFKMALEDEVKDNRLKMADRVEKARVDYAEIVSLNVQLDLTRDDVKALRMTIADLKDENADLKTQVVASCPIHESALQVAKDQHLDAETRFVNMQLACAELQDALIAAHDHQLNAPVNSEHARIFNANMALKIMKMKEEAYQRFEVDEHNEH